MAKRLTDEQKLRASICFECGCIPNKNTWLKIQKEKNDLYESIMYIAKQFNILEKEVITIEDLESKEEIHAVADNYNWDEDDTLNNLQAFLDHPLCDAGTALLIFWKGAGYHALSKNNNNERERIFYEKLVGQFKNKEFNTYQIAFNPFNEIYIPSLDECIKNNYVIPGELFCPYSTMYINTQVD